MLVRERANISIGCSQDRHDKLEPKQSQANGSLPAEAGQTDATKLRAAFSLEAPGIQNPAFMLDEKLE
jgi:hypothetical protein